MISLPFPFHAFLHGVQGQYCAWHPLQVLVGSVQTFSLFLIRKKVFFCHDCESGEGLGDVVHGPPALKEGAFGNRAQRGEKTDKAKKLGTVIVVCLCSRKAEHIYDKFQEGTYFSLQLHHCGYQTLPFPLLLLSWRDAVIGIISKYRYPRKPVACLSASRLGYFVSNKKKIREFCTFVF